MLEVLRFWLDLGLDGFRLDAVPVPVRARGDQLREPARDPRLPQARPRARSTRTTRTACCSPRPTSGRPTSSQYFGDGDECHMAFHFPVMPRMFMAVRREEAAPIYEILEQTPHDPRQLPVGPVPAQPRRADARDGHRRGARLHVRRVREGPADEAQPRDPPAARAAARQRPRRDRADDRDPVLAARLAGPLLRRRDRDGRQRVPRRPRRRAHADAVDRRPQRRLLARRLRAALRAAADGPGVRLSRRSTSRRSCAPPTSLLRWMHRFIALRKEHPVFGFGTYEPIEPSNPRIFAHMRRFEDDLVLCVHNLARSAQAVELDLQRVRGPLPGRAVRPLAVPADRRAALSADARARAASTGSSWSRKRRRSPMT